MESPQTEAAVASEGLDGCVEFYNHRLQAAKVHLSTVSEGRSQLRLQELVLRSDSHVFEKYNTTPTTLATTTPWRGDFILLTISTTSYPGLNGWTSIVESGSVVFEDVLEDHGAWVCELVSTPSPIE